MKRLILLLIIFLTTIKIYVANYPDLLAYWSFDDETVRDVTGNGYDGMMVNNPTPVPGVFGGALYFKARATIFLRMGTCPRLVPLFYCHL